MAVVTAILAGLLAALLPVTPAAADLTSVFPANGSGEIYGDLTTEDALFAYVTSNIRGGRVCVVAATGNGSCDSPAWGSPNVVVGIGTVFTLLEGPYLRTGTYRLMTEREETPGMEDWVRSAYSGEFTIRPCVGQECSTGIGRAQADEFKAASANAGNMGLAACAAFAIHKAVNTGTGIRGGLSSTSGGLAFIGSTVGGVLGISIDPTADKAKQILNELSCQVARMHKDIENDPPDPIYATVAAPVFGDPPSVGSDEVDELANRLDRQVAFGVAARIAYERYQGAVEDEDLAGQRRQATAASEYAFALADELRASADAAHAVIEVGDADFAGAIIPTTAAFNELAGVTARVTASGFTPAEVAQFQAIGATPEQIEIARTRFDLDLTDLAVGETLIHQMEETAKAFDDAVIGTDAFARAAGAVANVDLAPPTVGLSASTTAGSSTVTATAHAESPDGDPVTFQFDFGDGTGVATGEPAVEHTYAVDGNYTIQVTAIEDTPWGSTATATAVVDIENNRAPVAVDDEIAVVSGETTSVNVLANDSDPDGDPLTLTDVATAAGGAVTCEPDGVCTYTANPGIIGTESVIYTVSDGTRSTSARLRVTIVASGRPVTGSFGVSMVPGGSAVFTVPASDPAPGPSPLAVAVLASPPELTAAPVGPEGGPRMQVSVDPDASPGSTYLITFRVSDGAQTSLPATITVTVVATVAPPTATTVTVSTPQGVPVGITLGGSDPTGNPLNYRLSPDLSAGSWLGNTNGPLLGVGPHVGLDPADTPAGTTITGTYVVNNGVADSAPATITVLVTAPPGAPVVDLGPDQDQDEGYLTVTPLAARSPGGRPVTYAWTIDGVPAGDSYALAQLFDDGTYQLALTVTDELDNQTTDTMELRVANLAPSLAGPNLAGDGVTGFVTGINADATDRGNDPLTYRWDLGDGTSVEGDHPSVEHTYSTPGPRTVTVTVTDDDGATASASTIITVAALSIDLGPDRSVPEGSLVTLTATGNPGPGSASWAWDLGDETPAGNGDSVTHRWTDDQTRTVRITVTYQGTEVFDEVEISFTNVAPHLAPAVPLLIEVGELVHVRAGASDPGGDDLAIAWDFDDGATGNGERAEHSWATPGDRQVTVSADDGDGGETEIVTAVTVVAAGSRPRTPDSLGHSFHVAFANNVDPAASTQTLMITGERNTTGIVSVPGLGFRQRFTVIAGRVSIVTLPAEVAVFPIDDVEDRAVLVHAREEVTVYGANDQQFTTDAFLALPDDALGLRSRTMSYGGEEQLEVVPIGSNTTVTVTAPGEPAVVNTLDAGEVWHVPVPTVAGAEVTSDAPVQVLSGTRCANVPPTASACDHIVEAMWPVSMWGQRHLTLPLAGRAGDTFRVLADEDATEVRIDGILVATLGAGEWHETVLTAASEVVGSKPILVAQFSNGQGYDNQNGDPFMALVPPVEQWLDAYAVSTLPRIKGDHLNVVIRAGAQGTIRVDNAEVDSALWSPIGTSGYVGAQVPVSSGEHRITGGRPFALMAYGFAEYESYGYPGGLNLAPIGDAASLAVTPASASLSTGSQTCATATVTGAGATPVVGIRVDLQVNGVHDLFRSARTNASGQVTFCYSGTSAGQDSLAFEAGFLTAEGSRSWTSSGPNLPGPPTNVSGIGGDGDARIRWDAPLSNGGSPISSYEISTEPGAVTTSASGTELASTVDGLTNGQEYTVTVRAQNAVGWGPWSAPSNVLLPRASCAVDAFTDVPDDHPFCPEIKWMADEGIARGYPEGTYKPAAAVTRQAMAAFLYRVAGSPLGATPTCATKPFTDVAVGAPFCGEIKWAVDQGITTGYGDGGFHPSDPVTRQAMALFLYRLIDTPRGNDPQCDAPIASDVAANHSFCGEIDWMVDSGITGGYADGTFRPVAPIARQSMAAFVFRYAILADPS